MKVALCGVRGNGGDGEQGLLLLLGGDWLQETRRKDKSLLVLINQIVKQLGRRSLTRRMGTAGLRDFSAVEILERESKKEYD